MKRTGGPRAWRTRSDRAMRATGWSSDDILARILKGLWSPIGPKPPWALAAYRRHWITQAELLSVENVPGPTFLDLIYAPSPIFGMLRKETAA